MIGNGEVSDFHNSEGERFETVHKLISDAFEPMLAPIALELTKFGGGEVKGH